VHKLVDVEHKLLSAELIIEEEGVDVELALRPNGEVAEIMEFVHEDKLVSLSSD